MSCLVVGGMRLSGGRLPGEGRVELNRLGVWGAICDEDWDDRDATVVCRMLGLYVYYIYNDIMATGYFIYEITFLCIVVTR